MTTNDDELDALIEEFLDYCDFQDNASLSFNTSIAHLEREQRRQVLEEFMRYANGHFEPDDE
jgi:hemerythrin